MSTCSKCNYCWKDEGDNFPCCHFDDHNGLWPAPCEYADYEDEEEVEDRYTLEDLGHNWW